MANLESKFEELEAQLALQHTGIGNALDSILTALGAPPPTATVTLGTVSEQLTALNNNLIGIAIANGSFHSALLLALGALTTAQLEQHNETMEALALINVNTDTIITNNSLNAQRMIAALYATFCECEVGTTPLLAPLIDITPTELVDSDKCRRIQFYLDLFGQWLSSIANYGAAGAAVTGGTLATLLAGLIADAGIIAVGAEVGAAAGPPGIVIGAVVGLITVAIYTFGGSVLVDYSTQFNAPTMRDNMVQAMFLANNADEGYTAFKTTLLAGMDNIAAEVIYTLWWSAWSNDVYSGSPIVDDSAFDGTICGDPPEDTNCHIYDFIQRSDNYYYAAFNLEDPGDPMNTWNVGNYNGWRFTLLTTSDSAEFPVFDEGGNFAIFNAVGQSVVISRDTTHIAFQTRYNNTITSGTYEVCPPGSFIP